MLERLTVWCWRTVMAQHSINQRWAHPATDGKSSAWQQRIQHDGKAIETLPCRGGARRCQGFGFRVSDALQTTGQQKVLIICQCKLMLLITTIPKIHPTPLSPNLSFSQAWTLAPASCQKSLGIKVNHVEFPMVLWLGLLCHVSFVKHLQLQKCCRALPWHLTWSKSDEEWIHISYILICRFEVGFCKLSKLRNSIYIYIFHHSHKNLDTSEHPSIFQQFIIRNQRSTHLKSPQKIASKGHGPTSLLFDPAQRRPRVLSQPFQDTSDKLC